jgi:hypothetical protein
MEFARSIHDEYFTVPAHIEFEEKTYTTTRAPSLRRNQPNKVIVLAVSFNPPHLGHLELAYHTFLRSCPNTIALVFVPVGNRLGAKDGTKLNGKDWVLTRAQRAKLLHDDLIKRWSWCFMYDQSDVHSFQRIMVQVAKDDGFELSFTALSGSDHYENIVERGSMDAVDWDTGDCVTSDITRPPILWQGPGKPPKELPGCSPWREILALRSTRKKDDCACGCGGQGVECETSRRIEKFCQDHPALKGGHGASASEQIIHGFLVRCHEENGPTWTCRSESGGLVTFLPSGRVYPVDERRETISSSAIRKLFKKCPKDRLHGELKKVAMNPDLLLEMLGMSTCIEK